MIRQIVIDTETTGLDPLTGKHRVIEIALVEVIDNIVTGNSFQSYFCPEGKRSLKPAFRIHQIKDDFLVDKPLFKDCLDEIVNFIGDSELFFYNKNFDLKFLDHEALLAKSPVKFSLDYKSTCLMDYVTSKLGRKIKLDAACRIYRIDTTKREVHGALIDAQITADLLIAISKNLDGVITSLPHSKETKRNKPEKFSFPRAYNGVQVNFCKNTSCTNYGVPPQHSKKNKKGKYAKVTGGYKIQTKSYSNVKRMSLVCTVCGASSMLISNKALVQESNRLRANAKFIEPSCLNSGLEQNTRQGIPEGRRYKKIQKTVNRKLIEISKLLPPCGNHGKGILSHPDLYWLDSKNIKEVELRTDLPQIHQINSNTGHIHLTTELSSQTFKCKSCKTKFTSKINPQKGQRDHQINHQLFLEFVNKGIINRISDKLNIDHKTIYLKLEFFYKQCVQFDQYQLQQNLYKLKGRTLNLSMDRQHFYSNWSDKSDARRTKIVNVTTIDNSSRFALASTLNFDFTSDYNYLKKEFIRIGEYLKPSHKRRYPQYILPEEAIENDDDENLKPPTKHLLLQQTYSTMAHLDTLKEYFNEAEHVNLYADNDIGFEMSMTRTLSELIKSNKLTCALLRDRKAEKDDPQWIKQEQPVIKDSLIDVKFLTSYSESAINYASLYGVDNYFQMLRRRINMMERPIPTSSQSKDKNKENQKNQVWNGYGSYNPKYVSMLIEIFRVYNNYVLTDEKVLKRTSMQGKTARTPAQKIGLINQTFGVQDILEFSPAQVYLNSYESQKENALFS